MNSKLLVEISKINGYLTIKEASRITGFKEAAIRMMKKNGRISYKKYKNGRVLVNIEELVMMKDLKERNEESRNPWIKLDIKPGEKLTPIIGYDFLYAVSDYGRFFNLSKEKMYDANDSQFKSKGHIQVAIWKHGKMKLIYLHVLIAKQVANAYHYSLIHHIDGNPRNNLPSNLLPLPSQKTHKYLHKLLSENRLNEYYAEVEKWKKHNSTKLYKVPHPENTSSDCYDYWYYLSEEGYSAYQRGEGIKPQYIELETAEERI